jgi:hypothetical protein
MSPHRDREEGFEKYRAEISSLYVERNTTLLNVMEEMNVKYGVPC